MYVMKTIHEINAKLLNAWLRQMMILCNHGLQATTFTVHISIYLNGIVWYGKREFI